MPNAETWLGFTDLVFVDPVGTGFSRLIEPDDALRDRYLAIEGDVAALAQFVRRWLVENGRVRSPRYFVGESYGGFRGPLLAEALRQDEGLALDGLVLVSPVLDFGWWSQAEHTPWPAVALLPSLAAAEMEAEGRYAAADARGGRDLRGGRLCDRPAARRAGRGGGRTDRRPGDGADRARAVGRGRHRRAARRRGLRARGRACRGASDERLRRRGARGGAAARAAGQGGRPGARRDDRAADRGDAGALSRRPRLAAGPSLPAP